MRRYAWFLGGALVLVLGCSLLVTGCSSGGRESSPVDIVIKEQSLPAPSSLVEDEAISLSLTAKELVTGISGNNIKQNIEEYFGKYASITGVVKRIDIKGAAVDVTLDGEIDGELGGIICRINSMLVVVDDIEIGKTATVYGQIKALKEVPGNQVQDQLMIQSYAQLVKPCTIKP